MATSSAKAPMLNLSLIRIHSLDELFIIITALGLGTIFAPMLGGACLGYILGYHFHLQKQKAYPKLWPLDPVMFWYLSICMLAAIGGAAWGFEEVTQSIAEQTYQPGTIIKGSSRIEYKWNPIVHLVPSCLIMFVFMLWRGQVGTKAKEKIRHGSARFATASDLKPYQYPVDAFYIGGGKYYFDNAGHGLVCAGTRSGKGTGLIIPNLLGAGGFNGSWVVIDPKGENAAISAKYQRKQGKKVRILNPWNLLGLGGDTYNPLDLLFSDLNHPEYLPDDAQLIAQMIVPSVSGKEDHWNNRARSLIAAILMHLAVTFPEDQPSLQLTLAELWRLLRLSPDEWLELLKDMALNNDPISGPIINGSANEILAVMENSEKEAAGIISTAQRWTDIFKSIPLRKSLQSSNFSINELSEGNTVLYVIIPADKLKSHYAWLRLVVTTAMKAVVRNPNQRVGFLLDECYALGYLQELEVALGMYAGYGISVWTIWQSLVQIQQLYGKNWETFLGNSAFKSFFGVNDHTTAKYVSDMAGQSSVLSQGGKGASSRSLITADEVRRLKNKMLVFIDNLPVAKLKKIPYYEHPVWHKRAKPNPYYRD